MTETAADVARRVFSAWNDGGIAAVADDYWAAEMEWRDDPSVPDAGVFKGRDAKALAEANRLLALYWTRKRKA